jgi:hypothetical protein
VHGSRATGVCPGVHEECEEPPRQAIMTRAVVLDRFFISVSLGSAGELVAEARYCTPQH